jgi:hypothetical protein
MIHYLYNIYYENYRFFVATGIAGGGFLGAWVFCKGRPREEGPSDEIITGVTKWVSRIHLLLTFVLSGMAIGGSIAGTVPSTLPCLVIYWGLNLIMNRLR